MMKQMYSTGETARILNLPQRTVHKYCATGKIPALQHPISRTWKICHGDLMAYMRKNRLDLDKIMQNFTVVAITGECGMQSALQKAEASKPLNWNIQTFDDEYEAMIHIGRYSPDIVVVDHPGDGLKIIKAIKNNTNKKQLRVVVIVNYHTITEDLEPYGIDGILVKPFTALQLVKKIKEICNTDS